MIKVTLTMEVIIDVDNLGSVYSNEDYLLEDIKEHVAYGLDRLDATVTFIKTDVEGL